MIKCILGIWVRVENKVIYRGKDNIPMTYLVAIFSIFTFLTWNKYLRSPRVEFKNLKSQDVKHKNG